MPDSSALEMVDAVAKVGPLLSTTSDLPENPPPVSEPTPEPKPDSEPGTGPDKPGEAPPAENGDGTDPKPSGEAVQPKTDETPPHLKAQISRWKNRAAEAEKRFETLMTTVERLTKAPPQETKAEPAKTPDDPRPKRESFDSPEAYDSALVEWAAKNAARETETKTRKAFEEDQRSRQFNEIRDKWNERRDTFISTHEDYAEVAENDAVPIPAHMTAVIVQLENGPELAYHLGKNPGVAERLSKLSPAVAVYELGKVAATLAAPKPEVSKAPPPIKPVGSRANAGRKTPDDMSMDEYASMRRDQQRAEWRERHGMAGQTH